MIIVFGSRKTKPKDEIRLEKQYSVKSWLFSKGITFDETVVPPEVPRPYEAVMAARLASRLYLDPANKGEERQRSDAETYFNGLDILREHTKDSKTREYIWQFEQIVKNHGSRLADETRKTQSDVKTKKSERKTWKGKLGTAFDYVMWRGVGSYSLYQTLSDSLKDVQVDIYGVKVSGQVISSIGFIGAIIGTSAASKWWGDRSIRQIWGGLKGKSRKIYEQAAIETTEHYDRFFDGAVKGLKPKKEVNGY